MNNPDIINEPFILKVRPDTDAIKLSKAIRMGYDKDASQPIIMRAIGASSINQTIKAVIISNSHFAKIGKYACIVPSFKNLSENNKEVTAIEFRLKIDNV